VTALNLLKLLLKIAELPGEVIIFRIVSLSGYFSGPPDRLSPLSEKSVFFILRNSLLKGRDIATFLPLQGGGREGDRDLLEQYKYGVSIVDSLVNRSVFLRREA